MITEYHRPTMVYDPEKENKWGCGYWWDFSSPKDQDPLERELNM